MKPGEHKTVQARILGYAEAIGWTFVSREKTEWLVSGRTTLSLRSYFILRSQSPVFRP
jgi:hypothetical protein